MRLWNAQTGEPGLVLSGHSRYVVSVAYSPDGRQIASGAEYGVELWDAHTGAPGPFLQGHKDGVRRVVYSPNGQQIASGSLDKRVRLWDTKTGGTPGHILSGHTQYVRGVVYSPDGQRIASGADDQTVRLWDVESGQCLMVTDDFQGAVRGIAWKATSHGAYLVTCSHGKAVRVWQFVEGENGPRMILVWSSNHDRLVVARTSVDGVQGLSRVNMQLLQQRGATSGNWAVEE